MSRSNVACSSDRGWNKKLEETVKTIGETAGTHRVMHLLEAQRASIAYNRLTILGLVVGPLSGLLSAVEATTNPNENVILSISSILLGFLGGLIFGILKFGRYDERISNNKQTAARFTSIETNVRRQLGLYRMNRNPADEYLEWLNAKCEELFLNAPLLPLEAYYESDESSIKKNRTKMVIEVLNSNKEISISSVRRETSSDSELDVRRKIELRSNILASSSFERDLERDVIGTSTLINLLAQSSTPEIITNLRRSPTRRPELT